MANLRDISATEVELNNSICQTIAKYFFKRYGPGEGGGGGREVIVELTTKVSGGGIKKKRGYLTLSLMNLIRISPP